MIYMNKRNMGTLPFICELTSIINGETAIFGDFIVYALTHRHAQKICKKNFPYLTVAGQLVGHCDFDEEIKWIDFNDN